MEQPHKDLVIVDQESYSDISEKEKSENLDIFVFDEDDIVSDQEKHQQEDHQHSQKSISKNKEQELEFSYLKNQILFKDLTNFKTDNISENFPKKTLKGSSIKKLSTQNIKQEKKECTVNGVKISQKSTNEVKVMELRHKGSIAVSDLRSFLISNLSQDYSINITIRKVETGLFSSVYKFYLKSNTMFILSCEKQGFGTYIFSTKQSIISKEHKSFLGKMECNFSGSQYLLYDSGYDCGETKYMENIKRQLAYFKYEHPSGQPYKFDAFITTNSNKNTQFTIMDKEQNLIKKHWQDKKRQNLSRIWSKQPEQYSQQGKYTMNFRGLAAVPSIKNFIAEGANNNEPIIFGRLDKLSYEAKVKAPFSLLQACAMCVSSIHRKFL